MCLYPKLIKNRKYIPNKKNGGIIPEVKDERVLVVPAGCGKCIECKKQKARSWSIRLQEEIRTTKHGEFVTLTFSNESIRELAKEINNAQGYELDNAIAILAVRRFLERWRKKYKVSLRHWLVTELGHNGTENIHLHGIIFKNEEHDLKEQKKDIKEIWKYGYVYVGDYVNEKTINYCVKYSTKTDLKNPNYNAKILTSAGIGKGYIKRLDAQLNKYKPNETDERYVTRTGAKMALPTYWRNQIYSDEEREKLWIEKLNKNERWVLGSKIDTKSGLDDYFRVLKDARKKNKRLGYGSDAKDWNKINYENQQRQLKINKRIEKADEKEKISEEIEEEYCGFKKYKRN